LAAVAAAAEESAEALAVAFPFPLATPWLVSAVLATA
jgi:hypothetical protein